MATVNKKVWLITGCSSGLGLEIAAAALERGDTVVATARDPNNLGDLATKGAIIERLDVTASDSSLEATIASIAKRTGDRIDILVNNAGYILTGGVEECSREEVQAAFNTNVFGQLNVLRAVLPIMRRQRQGVVANMGSIGGWYGTPGAGLYCATKASAAILAEALRGEVAHLNIQVTAIEPGYTRTNFLVPGRRLRAKKVLEDVKEGVDPTLQALETYSHKQPGDPVKVARLIVEILTSSGRCKGCGLPPRLLIGEDAYKIVGAHVATHKENWGLWEGLTTATNHDE